jgi:hypothetical protein
MSSSSETSATLPVSFENAGGKDQPLLQKNVSLKLTPRQRCPCSPSSLQAGSTFPAAAEILG